MHLRFAPALRTVTFVLFSACIAGACASPAAPARTASGIPQSAERIARIARGLLPPVQIAGETAPWTIEERMRVHHVPGLVVAVFDDYRVVWVKGYGLADPSTGARATEMTLMQVGSIGKSVAAMVALEEARAGKLALDADINAQLTSWKLGTNAFTQKTPVTMRRLLSHTAGTNVPGFSGYAFDDPVPTLGQLLRGEPPAQTPAVVVDREPGTQFRYSGGGFLVVQQAIIDAEKGRSYSTIAEERVLRPLGMTRSTFEQPLSPAHARFAAAGHTLDKQVPGKSHIYPELASGGLWTTAGDLAAFWLEIQRALAGRESKVPVETATLLTTPVASSDPGEHVALGVFLSKHGSADYFGNHGTNTGYQAAAIARKGKGYGAVMIANSVGGSPDLFAEVQRAIAREYGWEGFEVPRFERRTVDIARLAGFAGRWTLGKGRGFSLTVRDGRLMFRAALEEEEELVPIDGGAFIGRESGARVTFPSRDEVVIASSRGDSQRASRLTNEAAAPIFLLEDDRFEQALVAYRNILSANPEDPSAAEGELVGHATKLFRKGRIAETVRLLRVDAALRPDSVEAYDDLSYVYDWMGERAKALDAYRTAISAMNRNPKASEAEKANFSAQMQRKMRRIESP